MTRTHTFRVFMNLHEWHAPTCAIHTSVARCDSDACTRAGAHVELGTYENLPTAPWVPPVGSYFRFRDPHPPGKETNHGERKGRVKEVVTLFYGTNTTVEVYLDAG